MVGIFLVQLEMISTRYVSLFRFSQFTNNAHYVQCRQMFLISGWLIDIRRCWANLIWYAEKLEKRFRTRRNLWSQDNYLRRWSQIYRTCVVRTTVPIPVLPNLVSRAGLATCWLQLCTHHNMINCVCNTYTLALSSLFSINRGPDLWCHNGGCNFSIYIYIVVIVTDHM